MARRTVFRWFHLWSKKGVLAYLFKALANLADMKWVFIDGSKVGAHQHSAGARR